METPSRMSSQRLTLALRSAGVVALIASAVVFMVQGFYLLDTMARFFSFFGVTTLMALLGLFMGIKMREGQSARTFLGLAAAATPVLFSQLGAMLYSSVNGAVATGLPKVLIVTAPSLAMAVGAAVGATVVLTPALYVGFGAFYRTRAQGLLLYLLIGCFLLLIPTRDANVIGAVIAVWAAIMYATREQMQREDAGQKESLIAFCLPMAPVAILAMRELFYLPTDLFGAATLAWLASFLGIVAPMCGAESSIRTVRQWAFAFAALSWYFFGTEMIHLLPELKAAGLMLTIYPPAAFAMYRRDRCGRGSAFVGLAFGLATWASISTLIDGWGIVSALALAGLGCVVSVSGFAKHNSTLFKSGMLTAGCGLIYLLSLSFRYFSAQPWLSLAILGIGVILLAGWIESNKHGFVQVKSIWKQRFE